MLHALLIEDNPADVMLIREGMRRSHVPADVVIAYDGEEGLEWLLESRFDLVILDLNVPKLDGRAVLAQSFVLAERLKEGLPPVYVFSGSQDSSDRERSLALGAKEYIVKPSDFEEFVKAVQGILERFGSP